MNFKEFHKRAFRRNHQKASKIPSLTRTGDFLFRTERFRVSGFSWSTTLILLLCWFVENFHNRSNRWNPPENALKWGLGL